MFNQKKKKKKKNICSGCCNIFNIKSDLYFGFLGYIHANGGSSSKGGGGGGLIGISYSSGYVTGELTAYGGSGNVENGAAGITYIKAGLSTKKVGRLQLRMKFSFSAKYFFSLNVIVYA